jgi:hypothetical protein
MRRATRNAADRVARALMALSEQLDNEPDAVEFQAEVDRMQMALADAERTYLRALKP